MALLKDDLEALRRVPFFAAVDSRRLRLLAFTAPRFSYDEGNYLFREGDDGDSAFVIMEGDVDISLPIDGKEVHIARLGKYDMVGETSLLTNQIRTATVKAATHVEVLQIKKGQFCDLVRNSPDMGLCIMQNLAEKLSTTAHEFAALKSKQVPA